MSHLSFGISPRHRRPSLIRSTDPFGVGGKDDVLQRRTTSGPRGAQSGLVRGIPRADAVESRRGKVELVQLRESPKDRRQPDEKALKAEVEAHRGVGGTESGGGSKRETKRKEKKKTIMRHMKER